MGSDKWAKNVAHIRKNSDMLDDFIDFYKGKFRDPLFGVRVTKVGITKSAV